jgi:Domain of unknown function (DUF4157)
MMKHSRPGGGGSSTAAGGGSSLAPGRRTLIEGLVQRLAAGAAQRTDRAVHDIAREGVAGGGGKLPHADAIQRSFGPDHDVSQIDAHVGGVAGEAAAEIGAAAYATGSSVAFQQAPDLFTAAHEAAHVVQQRHGVQLLGGIGSEGDAYEQHADAVAERVVRGESAADLLSGLGSGGATTGVQRMSSMRSDAVAAMTRIRDKIGPLGTSSSATPGGAYEKHVTSQSVVSYYKTAPARHAQLITQDPATYSDADKKFLAAWDAEGPQGPLHRGASYSGCNTFDGVFSSRELGLSNLGLFTVATENATKGQYVTAAPGVFPQQGDIIKMSGLHMCVSFNAPQNEGDTWEVLEAGQAAGPGADGLSFHSKPYKTGDVAGWVDIDAQAAVETAPLVAGTWEVTVDGDVDDKGAPVLYLYTFAPGGSLTWTNAADPSQGGGGTWQRRPGQVDFVWTRTGTSESWNLAEIKRKRGVGFISTAGGTSFKKR